MVDSERVYAGPLLAPLRVEADDPEVARARAAVQERLLGVPAAPVRIGRFVVLERIGAGGMGIVYAAYDPQLDRKVAIKLLFDRGASARQRARVVREAKAMAKLAHPSVVHVYEVGEHGGRLFLAMEYVRGQTLRQWWNAGERTIRDRLAMCLQAGRGLAAAHAAGIVHGDFKPDNVLIGEDGRARVLDFGLARIVEAPITGEEDAEDETLPLPPRRALTDGEMGTPGYVAPEQLRGHAPDPCSDQFSFCVTVWEAFSGSLPFADAVDPLPIRSVPRAKLPAWIEVALRRGLAVDRRWSSMDELLHELARDPSIVRNRRIGVVAVVAAIGTAFAIGATTQSGTAMHDPCGGGRLALEGAWPAEARAATLQRIAAADEYGESLAPELGARLDDYTSRWTAAHREACEAHRRGEQSSELLDRRVTCLDRGRVSLETIGRIARDRVFARTSSYSPAEKRTHSACTRSPSGRNSGGSGSRMDPR
jgi:eukaryotic-like serine/threonine-protein kinase